MRERCIAMFFVMKKRINFSLPKLKNKNEKESFRQQNDLDKKLVYSLNPKKIPSLKQLKHLPKVLSFKEKRLTIILIFLIVASLIFIAGWFYSQNFLPTPTVGGEYVEGLIGAPQYINPLLSQTNDVDSDISRLIFSGLLRYDKNLELVADLAEKWEISTDQKTYTFVLKPDLTWHDGQSLTADDIVFTVKSIQDPDFKSPLLVSLRGVGVEKIDDRTIKFTLADEPYPAFLEVLTFGILPEHIWGDIPAINANLTEYNLKPIGSGPWQFKSIAKDKLGNIRSYTIVHNPNYSGPAPYLEKITFKFYPDFETGVQALKNHSAEGISFLPKELKKNIASQKNLKSYSFYLPQYTAIFFNQKENEVLKDKKVREALALAIDKPKILSEALQLEGEIIDGPILPGSLGHNPELQKINFDPNKADLLLSEAGWNQITAEEYQSFLEEQKQKEEEEQKENEEATSKQPTTTEEIIDQPAETPDETSQSFYRKKDDTILEITLTTVDQPENRKATELIQEFWQNIGVKVNLEIIESSKISRQIIKPRAYEALLFGIIVGSDPDPYPFWHSSQVQDPGLNLSLLANRKVDKLLEDARKAANDEERQAKYKEFQDTLVEELPAIFLHNPTYTYVVDQKIKGVDIDRIIIPADRFNNLSDWYIKTKRKFKGNL